MRWRAHSLRRASRFAAMRGRSASERARIGVLLVALGAANHHFIQLTVVPIVLWIIAQRWRENGRPSWHSLAAWTVLFVAGASLYVLLPLRAGALASLPRPTTLAQVVDVASARVFAKNTGLGVPGTWGRARLEVLDWLGENADAGRATLRSRWILPRVSLGRGAGGSIQLMLVSSASW